MLKLNKYIKASPHDKQYAALLLNHVEEIFYGGAAGGGKTEWHLMEALQYVDIPGYSALILMRSYSDLSLPGALIPKSKEWLSGTDATWNQQEKRWHFPSGATLTFGYLEHEDDKYRYKCFHPDTEILTSKGWVNVGNVKVGDTAVTMNPESREMLHRPVTDFVSYDYDGNLCYLNQRQGAAFAVTPEHKIWASTNRRPDKLNPYNAKDLPYTAKIPQWGEWASGVIPKDRTFSSDGNNGKSITFNAKDYCTFLGWWLSEGYIDNSGKQKRWGVVLSQCQGRIQSEMCELLSRNKIHYYENEIKNGRVLFSNKALCLELQHLSGSRKKSIPREVFLWKKEYQLLLLKALVDTDDTWRDKDYACGHFVTVSDKLANDICELAVYCGYRPTITKRMNTESHFKEGYSWHVSLFRRDTDTMVMKRLEALPYKGKVYCVTVPPYHLVMTRFKGKVSWSGQSSEFQHIGFDELTQFSQTQYEYMFSRLRRKEGVGVPIRMRSSGNPDGPGFEWVKSYFINRPNSDTRYYIPALITDNPYLDRKAYTQSLMHLDPVTRQRLLEGDWNVRPEGKKFKREWFDEKIIPYSDVPLDAPVVRFWDMASTEPKPGQDPDYTAGAKVALDSEGNYYVLNVKRFRLTPQKGDEMIRRISFADAKAQPHIRIRMEQEPGSSGVRVIDHFQRRVLQGLDFKGVKTTGSKEVRANPVSSQAEAGNIYLVDGSWVNEFLDELCAFPTKGVHDDQVDALSGGCAVLALPPKVYKNVPAQRGSKRKSLIDIDRENRRLNGG